MQDHYSSFIYYSDLCAIWNLNSLLFKNKILMVGDLFKFILGMQLNISSSGVNFFSFLSLIFFLSRESLSIEPWLSWNFLCKPDWLLTRRDPPACASWALGLKACAIVHNMLYRLYPSGLPCHCECHCQVRCQLFCPFSLVRSRKMPGIRGPRKPHLIGPSLLYEL